jgi:hypothetical protein
MDIHAGLLHPRNASRPMACNAPRAMHPERPPRPNFCTHRMHTVPRYSNSSMVCVTHPDKAKYAPRPNYCTHGMHSFRWFAAHPERPPWPNYCTHGMPPVRQSATHPGKKKTRRKIVKSSARRLQHVAPRNQRYFCRREVLRIALKIGPKLPI